MFTGVIRHFGEILAAEPQSAGVRLTVRPEPELPSVRAGDSIALDGICLTVVDPAPDGLLFDVIQQTLDLTSLHTTERSGSGSFGTGHAGGGCRRWPPCSRPC